MTSTEPIAPTHEVPIHGITSEGAGVGRLSDGRTVFVHRTAPGDRVRVRLREVRKRWARADLVEVLDKSSQRRTPPCPHYARCGGCTLEHLSYDSQLDAKAGMVTDALERIGKRKDVPAPEIHPSPRELRYRNRVSFTLRRNEDGDVTAGFHELEAPGEIVEVDGRCLLPEQPIANGWDGLRAAWGEKARRLPAGRRLRLTLRALQGGAVILLVEGGEDWTEPKDAAFLIERVHNLRAVWHRSEHSDTATALAGDPRLAEVWYGEELPAHPSVFVQTNRDAAEHLHEMTLREVGPARGRTVLDAYAGVGAYARRLTTQGATATAIEVNPEAVSVARHQAARGFRILEGRVEDRLADALPAEIVILNPPRTGVEAGVMERLADARPERIVYVSCDPATLARDVRRLGSGYGIGRLQVFDLFPQTAHVETLLTLTRR